jgi:hypothetical protein
MTVSQRAVIGMATLGLLVVSASSSTSSSSRSVSRLSGLLTVQANAEIVLVDWAGRADSVLSDGDTAGGIPGCERYEEPHVLEEDPGKVTTFTLTSVRGGVYHMWIRPSEVGGLNALTWIRHREQRESCTGHWPLELPQHGEWYRVWLRLARAHGADSCGIRVGPAVRMKRPMPWR